LESLRNQSHTGFDILVIDNGSTDQTLRLIESKGLNFMVNPTRKFSYILNLAWKSLNVRYLVYLADDVELQRDWMQNALLAFGTDSRIAVVGGPIIWTREPTMHRLFRETQSSRTLRLLGRVYESVVMEGKILSPGTLAQSGAVSIGASLIGSTQLKTRIDVDLLTTSAMMIRRDVISQIGGFDENFYFNHADGDLFVRIKRAGYRLVFDPTVIATHHVRLGPSRNLYYVARDTSYFLAKDIKPKTWSGKLRVIVYASFFNLYCIYESLRAGDPTFVGVRAFFSGFVEYINQKSKRTHVT